jgi:hypothetical protein
MKRNAKLAQHKRSPFDKASSKTFSPNDKRYFAGTVCARHFLFPTTLLCTELRFLIELSLMNKWAILVIIIRLVSFAFHYNVVDLHITLHVGKRSSIEGLNLQCDL